MISALMIMAMTAGVVLGPVRAEVRPDRFDRIGESRARGK